jgi:ketosteroid isomerase-like protein
MGDAMHPFQRAVEVRDIAAIEDSLADDVVFTSPNTFRPYRGKSITAAFLRAVLRVLDDFRYVRQITDGEGHDHAFVFEARIGDVAVSGCASTATARSTTSSSWSDRSRQPTPCRWRWAPKWSGSSTKLR